MNDTTSAIQHKIRERLVDAITNAVNADPGDGTGWAGFTYDRAWQRPVTVVARSASGLYATRIEISVMKVG